MSAVISGTLTTSYTLSDPASQNPAILTPTGAINVNSPNAFTNGINANGGFQWTIINGGTVTSVGSYGVGINLATGGLIQNFPNGIGGGAYIAGSAVGIQINGTPGNTAEVDNNGTVRTTSKYRFANAIVANNIAATITNNGSIIAQNSNNYAANGIQLAVGGVITNTGLIDAISGGSGQTGIISFSGNTAVTNSGTIAAVGPGGLGINLATGSITNSKLITGLGGAIALGGGVINNYATGSIAQTGGAGSQAINVGASGAGTIVNTGSITAASTSGNAILVAAGGAVIRNGQAGTSQGVISGYHTGIGFFPPTGSTPGVLGITNYGIIQSTQTAFAAGSAFTINTGAGTNAAINNFGTISTAQTNGGGAVLLAGGVLVNQGGGVIKATGGFGVIGSSAPLTVVNFGIISGGGVAGIGANLSAGSTLTNGGTIIGSGGAAVSFSSAGSDRLILFPTASFGGSIFGGGGTLELEPGGSGTIRGLGTTVTGFGTLQFDTNAAWTVEGTISGLPGVITGFVSTDAIVVDGFVAVSETFTNGGLVLTDAANDQITLGLQGGYRTSDFRLASANSGTGTRVTVVGPQQSPNVLSDFGWAQGWGSPDNPRIVSDIDSNGSADYVGFGSQYVLISYGGSFNNSGTGIGPGYTNAAGAVQDFGTAEGYTVGVQRGAAATGAGFGETLYGQGFAGVYWYAANGETPHTDDLGKTYDILQYQSAPNLYGNFGSQQGWTPHNGFQILKASTSDSYASILGFGAAGIIVGAQAFAPGATAAGAYGIDFAAGNNFGWDQQVDIRTFQAGNGSTIDLNHDGIADFVGMGPQGLVFAYGNENGGNFGLGPSQTAQISGSNTDLGEAQGWTNATTLRDIVADPKTGFDDILAFGAAGVYVAMGQDPNTHNGQPFGQLYLAMPDFGSNQGWSVLQTPRIVGDVTGDGTPDIVGFGASATFVAVGSRDANNNLFFNLDPSQQINDFGSSQSWSGTDPQTVRSLGDVAGTGHADLILSGAFNTQLWQFT